MPPYGWIGVDPTAGAPCTGRHVKVAVGRDYADVSVVRGTYRGGGAAAMEVTVEVGAGWSGGRHARGRRPRGRAAMIQYQTAWAR